MTIDHEARAGIERLVEGSSLGRTEVRRVRDRTPAELRDELVRLATTAGLVSGYVGPARAHEPPGGGRDHLLHRLAQVADLFEAQTLSRTADMLVLSFDDVRDAFAAAIEAAAPELRLAVHAYPVLRAFGGPPPAAVDEVSLLGRIGHGGQVLVSAGARDAVGRLLPTDALLKEVGCLPADDPSGEGEVVHQLCHRSLPDGFPPPPGGEERAPAPLVGREGALGDIARALRPGAVVTLVGEAGVGKSRLVREAARRYEQAVFLDGVVICDLVGVRGAATVVERLAAALGTPSAAEEPDLRTKVVKSLRHRLLVVLDGCGALDAEAVDLVRAIVRDGSEATVLATSRRRLPAAGRAPDEHVIDVGPLSLRDEDAQPSPAAALLSRLAGAGAAGDVDLGDVARRVGAVPLAIELVAPLLDPNRPNPEVVELAARLGRGRAAGGEPLAAAVELAIGRLGEPAVSVFTACSRFSGGWTGDGAEAVAAALGVAPADVRRSLARLQRQAVVRAGGAHRDGPRFCMPQAVRAHAAASLATDRGDEAAVAEAHADFFADLVAAAWAPRRAPAEATSVRAVDADFDNIRLAHRWLVENGRHGDAAAMVWQLGDDALMRGRHEVGHWGQALGRLAAPTGSPMRGAALAIGSNTALIEGRHALADDLANEALRADGADLAGAHWVALNTLALVAFRRGDRAVRRRLLAEVDARGERERNTFARVVAAYETVMLGRIEGDAGEAQAAAEALRSLAGPGSSPSMLAMAALAEGMTIADDPRTAQWHLERGMALASSVRNTLLSLQGWRASRDLVFDRGERVAAVRDLRDVARQFRAQGNASETAQTLAALLLHLVALGRTAEAATICVHLSQTPFRSSEWFRLAAQRVREAFRPGARWPAPLGEGGTMTDDELEAYVDEVVDGLVP